MATEWKVTVTASEDALIEEIQRVRAQNPDGPPPTKTAIIKAGVRTIHAKEVKGS